MDTFYQTDILYSYTTRIVCNVRYPMSPCSFYKPVKSSMSADEGQIKSKPKI